MRTLIRGTATANEYWDTIEKKSISVPIGEEPGFDVVEDPKSLVNPEVEPRLIETRKKDQDNSKDDASLNKDLSDMTVTEIKGYAKNKGLEIPGDIAKKGDLITWVLENEQGDIDQDSTDSEEAK